MNLPELILIAVGLSMDAFAVAICAGLSMRRVTVRKSLVVGLYFGVFQAVMPFAGYLAATRFAEGIVAYDHWIALILLCAIGGHMIAGSFRENGCSDRKCQARACEDRECPNGARPNKEETSLSPASMLPLAVATSIDALAVGVSFAFLNVDIVPAVLCIGFITLVLSMAGVKTGHLFGARFQSKAELAGGVILVMMGVKILLEHMWST